MIGYENNNHKYIFKGLPLKTIDKHGNDVQLISKQDYEDLYNNETITKQYATLQKNLYGKTYISAHTQTRTFKMHEQITN